jgi:hypothetical protein
VGQSTQPLSAVETDRHDPSEEEADPPRQGDWSVVVTRLETEVTTVPLQALVAANVQGYCVVVGWGIQFTVVVP